MPKNLDLLDIVPGYQFWREGCATYVSSVCEILTHAEITVEPATIIRFIRDIELFLDSVEIKPEVPDFCDQCFRTAFDLTQGKESRKRYEELMHYFLVYLNQRSYRARKMLADSVVGIVSCFEKLER